MVESDSINQPITAQPPTDRVFVNRRKIARNAVVVFGVAILSLVVGVFLVLFLLLAPPQPNGVTSLSTFASTIICISLFGVLYGIVLLKSPVRICLDAEGIQIEWLVSRKRFAWAQIAELQRKKSSGLFGASAGGWGKQKAKDILILCDERGKRLAEVDSAVSGFPELVAEIEARSSAAQGAATYDRDAQRTRQLRSQKWSVRLCALAGGCFLVLGLVGGISTWVDHQKERQLAMEGVVTNATIVRHYIYNVTPRLEYEFTDEQGRGFSADVSMERGAWETLEGEQTVAIRYLPSDPDRSHLLIGEVKDELPFLPMMFGSALMVGLGVLCLVGYLFGIADVKVERGKVRLIRMGQVDDSLEPDAAATKARAVTPPPPLAPPGPIVAKPAEPAFSLAAQPPPRTLPPGIKAVAILNIVFGLGGMFFNAARFAFSLWVANQNGMVDVGHDYYFEVDQNAIQWARVEHAVCFGLALLLGCSAIGLFRVRPWGRRVALVAVCGQILVGIVAVVGTLRGGIDVEGLPPEHRFAVYVGVAGAVFLSLLGMVYPTVVLVVLCRRSARELFAPIDRDTVEFFSG